MDKDLEYFAEFLEDPSAPPIGEFYRMVRAWCVYLLEHKDKFNYLEDDEWKEIRARLLDEMYDREDLKKEIDAEWDELCAAVENIRKWSDAEAIKILKRKVEFMKTYRLIYEFTDEQINSLEAKTKKIEKSVQKNSALQQKLVFAKLDFEKSLEVLDEQMQRVFEQTGKFPHIHFYRGAKRYRGN